jgi:hypothetical protein
MLTARWNGIVQSQETSSFIQECVKQTRNIGETPEADNPETLERGS